MNLKEVSSGTWGRMILLIAALVNDALVYFTSGTVISEKADGVICLILTVIASAAAYWKNNSFTHQAIIADRMMNTLKKGE